MLKVPPGAEQTTSAPNAAPYQAMLIHHPSAGMSVTYAMSWLSVPPAMQAPPVRPTPAVQQPPAQGQNFDLASMAHQFSAIQKQLAMYQGGDGGSPLMTLTTVPAGTHGPVLATHNNQYRGPSNKHACSATTGTGCTDTGSRSHVAWSSGPGSREKDNSRR